MMTLRDHPRLARLVMDRRGGVLPLVAVAMMVLLGTAALALDAGQLYVVKNQLQTAVDFAALAGGRALPNATAAREAALQAIAANLSTERHGTAVPAGAIELGHWDDEHHTFASGVSPADAIRVTARRSADGGNPVASLLAGAIGVREMTLTAQAIARRGEPPCVLALRPTDDKAILLSGGSSMNMPNCPIQVNSDGAKAIEASGGGVIQSRRTCVVGNYNLSGASSATPPIQTGCTAIADPLASLAPPPVGTCTYTNWSVSGGSHTLSPGVYCGGISASSGADLTFRPGIYVIKDGPFSTSGGGSITASGVGFYLTGTTAKINWSGGPDLYLRAPTFGAMAGLIFYQGTGTTAGATNVLSGGGTIWIEGTVYFPTQHMNWSGGSMGTVAPYSLFIVWDLVISGGGQFKADTDYAASTVPLPAGLVGGRAKLVR